MFGTLLLAAATLALCAPRVAHAQARAESARSRLWYEVAIGGAGARLTCDLCTPTRDVGAMGSVAIGAYANPNLRVGVELSGWTYTEDPDVREHLDGLGIVAQLTPNPANRIYLIGGLGWSGYRAGDFTWNAPRLSVGVGYEMPAFGSWSVGNTVILDGSGFGALRSDGQTVLRNVGMSSVRASVVIRRR